MNCNQTPYVLALALSPFLSLFKKEKEEKKGKGQYRRCHIVINLILWFSIYFLSLDKMGKRKKRGQCYCPTFCDTLGFTTNS